MRKPVLSAVGLIVGMGLLTMSNVGVAQEFPPSDEPEGGMEPVVQEPLSPPDPGMEMPGTTDPVQNVPSVPSIVNAQPPVGLQPTTNSPLPRTRTNER